MSNVKKNKKIVEMVHESREKLEKIELDIKPKYTGPCIPPIPTPLPPMPVIGPEFMNTEERKLLLNETQAMKETISHLKFPDEIHVSVGPFDFDIGLCLLAGGICFGIALSGLFR